MGGRIAYTAVHALTAAHALVQQRHPTTVWLTLPSQCLTKVDAEASEKGDTLLQKSAAPVLPSV